MTSQPLMPVELLERIISEAWSLPLRPSERTTLFLTHCLINRTWLDLFIHTALTDVHITSDASARHYLHLLRPRGASEANDDFLLPHASETANLLCRSLTFHIDATDRAPLAVKLYSAGDSAAGAVSSTLYMLGVMRSCVPHLRSVRLEYFDWGFDDIFDQYRLVALPRQVTELRVVFRFSPVFAQGTVLRDLRRRYELLPHPFGRFSAPGVRTLDVRGATTAFVAGLLDACPRAATLAIDEHVELPVVPPWVRTLVLLDARSRADRQGDDWLVAPRGTPLLCPVASVDHERARKRLRGFCARNGVHVIDA